MTALGQLQYAPVVLWLAFILGLAIGSFLNVVGHRFLTEESVLYPPSHCPHCKTSLRAMDNIPVLSYLLLQGQCRACQVPISLQYPLVEIFTGLLFVGVVWQFGLGLQTLFLLFLIVNLVVITITDWRESFIFEINSLSLIPIGLLYNFLNLGHATTGPVSLDLWGFSLTLPAVFLSAVVGVVGAFVIFEGMILLSKLAFGTDGFGHGDTHLMMGVGAFLGWELCVMALCLGFVFQAAFAIPVLILQWIRQRNYASLLSGGAAFFFGLLPLLLGSLSPGIRSILVLACMALTLASLFIFLKQMRQTQSYTYMPLGPALILGSLVALFWGSSLLRLYQGFLHSSY